MRIELPPFRVDKKAWTAVHLRRSLPRLALSSGLLGVGVGILVGTSGGSVALGVLTALGTFVGVSLAFYVRSAIAMGRQGELPWEVQSVTLDDEAYRTAYTSGFAAQVPWGKFRRARRFTQGLFLETEGSGGAFLPAAALNPEAEAFITERVGR